MTANDPTPQDGENVSDAQHDDLDDDEPVTVGIASTTTDPMELDVSVKPLPFEGTAKLRLHGTDDHPGRGVSTTAYLPSEDARELGEALIDAADELEDADD